MLANDKTNCYKCKHKRSVPGNCHIACANPDPKMSGDPHGIKNGWFIYPLLFDPIWKNKVCDNMEWVHDRVFLGGTCAETTWRDELIPNLEVAYFNPIVEDWTPECQEIEESEKWKHCNIHLYVITSAMKGVFSIAEVIESVHAKYKKTILFVNPTGFEDSQLRSLEAVSKMVVKHGGIAITSKDMHLLPNIIKNGNS